MSQTPDERSSDKGRLPHAGGPHYTRWAAAAVLVPTVPLLLLSIAALAVFYAAPTRFGRILAQLPGDEIIRSMLVFAPATLLGIVILAALYALERPEQAPQARIARRSQGARQQRLAQASSLLIVPTALLFLGAMAAWLLAFVAPDRWQALLAPLPGDRYLAPMLKLVPWVLLVALALLVWQAWRGRSKRPASPPDGRRAARIGAVATLIGALPLLGLSLTALVVFAASPDRFQKALARLSQEAFIRLGLVFTPAALLSLVLLALLVLFFSAVGRGLDRPSVSPTTGQPAAWRQSLAVWVLTAGLTFSAMVALGLGGVAIYLVLR
jgi:hypothetical protein